MRGIIGDAVAGFTGVRFRAGFVDDVDDRWYQPRLGGITPEGVIVTPETIFLCGVVLAAIRFRADIFSQSQPTVVRRVGNKREELPNHYAQQVLRSPCLWLTGVRWRHLNMVRAQLGNSYNRIVPSATAAVGELRPLDPYTVRVQSQRADGSLVYEYRPGAGRTEILGQEQVLHFRGFSLDGQEGIAMANLLRNAVEIALLAERHTSTTLKKGARIAGLLIPEGPEGGKEKRRDLADSVNEVFSAHENTGAMGVLPYGVKFQALSMDHQKAQLLELRDFQIGDLLRFLGVPGVVVGYGEKTATFASAEAFFEEARRCVLPWVVNFEAEEMQALLPEGEGLQIKHNLDAVLRADTSTRFEALQKASGRPWLTGNEVRTIEDMDPIEDDRSMDRVAPPPNQSGEEKPPGDAGEGEDDDEEGAPSPPPARPRPAPAPEDEEAAAVARLRQSAFEAWSRVARHVVRREASAVRLAAQKRAAAPNRWRAWVDRYYATAYPALIARVMDVDPDQARAYAFEHRTALLEGGGVAAAEQWVVPGSPAVARLAWLAMGEER